MYCSYNSSAPDPWETNKIEASRKQCLTPKLLNSKTWKYETTDHQETTSAKIKGSTLLIGHKYGGVNNHTFKASLLKTSTDYQKSFALIIEDLEENDDDEFGVKFVEIEIELSSYLQSDCMIKIFKRISRDQVESLTCYHYTKI